MLPQGVEIRKGATERLRITFAWQGQRRRETLNIPVTPTNIKYAGTLRASVQNSIERGTFDYAEFFPGSAPAKKIAKAVKERLTVGALIDDYISTARRSQSLSPSTIASYARWNKARLSDKWGERYADEVQTTEIRSWIADLVGEMDVKSVRNCVGLFSAVINRAASDSSIPSNPMTPIKLKSVLPKAKKSEGEDIDPFSDDEIAAILGACRTVEEKALWKFAFATGLRTGELIAVKWGNIDAIWGSVHVQDNVVSADSGTVEKDTKTGKVRDVPLLPAAKEALEAMRPMTRIVGDYIFCHPITRKRWMDDQQMRAGSWKPTLLRAGVRYRYPYQTRHTFASRLLMGGEQELLVANLLGHNTVEMARRSYGKYIKQTGGVMLRGDYSTFGAAPENLGANLGHLGQLKAPLSPSKPKRKTP